MNTPIVVADRFVFAPEQDLLGHGGMGTVYRSLDLQTKENVAVKVLKPSAIVEAPNIIERFIREGEALRQLDHPNIVKMLTTAHYEGRYYLVMEYVPGGSLRQLLNKQGPLPLERVLRFGLELSDALARAHYLNIIHRDIKPDNVLIGEDETPHLTDFGIAHLANFPRLTQAGAVMGTISYLSPEACCGEPLDTRTDIWSFGIMLYEMLAGKVPFIGPSIADVMQAIQTHPLPDISLYRPDIPEALADLVQRMLVKDSEWRIPSVRIVAVELEAILQGRTESALITPQKPVSVTETVDLDNGLLQPTTIQNATQKVFICYAQHIEPDQDLARYLHDTLSAKSHVVFIDKTMRTGTRWLQEIDKHLKSSDFVIVLLSETSADSEMVQSEVRRAYEYHKQQGTPTILPVRVSYEGLLPYSIDAFLNPFQYVVWRDESDNERVSREVLRAMEEGLPNRPPFPAASAQSMVVISEDGRSIPESEEPSSPLPEFDPRLLEELISPGGTVRLRDKFYVERDADAELKRHAVRTGNITTIRASRQTGKSSLLVRGVQHARLEGAKIVPLDLQQVDRDYLASADSFLHYLATIIVRKLHLNPEEVKKAWQGSLGPQDKLTYLLEDYVLEQATTPIVLAMDEADRLLETDYHTDFFGLIRSWHNKAAYDERWEKLNMIMVISTEPYLLIADVTQSPFNVGNKLYLRDFSVEQAQDLNRRHQSPVNKTEFPEFMQLLGGQPYLTRKALYTLVTENLTWEEFLHKAPTDKGPFSDHLRRQLWLLRDEPALRAALKQVVHEHRCDDEAARFRLLRAGLIKGSGDVYKCRCGLYYTYFEARL